MGVLIEHRRTGPVLRFRAVCQRCPWCSPWATDRGGGWEYGPLPFTVPRRVAINAARRHLRTVPHPA